MSTSKPCSACNFKMRQFQVFNCASVVRANDLQSHANSPAHRSQQFLLQRVRRVAVLQYLKNFWMLASSDKNTGPSADGPVSTELLQTPLELRCLPGRNSQLTARCPSGLRVAGRHSRAAAHPSTTGSVRRPTRPAANDTAAPNSSSTSVVQAARETPRAAVSPASRAFCSALRLSASYWATAFW